MCKETYHCLIVGASGFWPEAHAASSPFARISTNMPEPLQIQGDMYSMCQLKTGSPAAVNPTREGGAFAEDT